MSSKDLKWENPLTGETFIRGERVDGTHWLKTVRTGEDDRGAKAVFDANGNVKYLRDFGNRIIANDQW